MAFQKFRKQIYVKYHYPNLKIHEGSSSSLGDSLSNDSNHINHIAMQCIDAIMKWQCTNFISIHRHKGFYVEQVTLWGRSIIKFRKFSSKSSIYYRFWSSQPTRTAEFQPSTNLSKNSNKLMNFSN